MHSKTGYPRLEDVLDGERLYIRSVDLMLRSLPGWHEREQRRQLEFQRQADLGWQLQESARLASDDGWGATWHTSSAASSSAHTQATPLPPPLPSRLLRPALVTRRQGRPKCFRADSAAFRRLRTELRCSQQDFAAKCDLSLLDCNSGPKQETARSADKIVWRK